jgi:Tol biopolymer transport system component
MGKLQFRGRILAITGDGAEGSLMAEAEESTMMGWRKTPAVLAACAWWLAAGAGAFAATPCTLDRATGTTVDADPFLRNAWGSRWNKTIDRVAFMQPGAAGYYRVFTIRPDGSDRVALTEGRPGLPTKHQGSVYWHPSGRYLLFTAQKQEWSGMRLFGNPDYEAMPGFGRHDDLWLITPDGSRLWQLIDEPNTRDEGVLMPVFSPSGRQIAWSARQPGGKYVLKVADFVETPRPHLQDIRSYQPGGVAYYETGSFTSDGKSLTYTSDQDTHSFWHSQIYRLDLRSGVGTRLTVGNDYNEHPTVVNTPGGDWIVYMSTNGVRRLPFHFFLGTDWYAMKPDGSAAKRLTTMNAGRRDDPENTGEMQVAGTIAMSAAGDYFLGDVQDNLVRQTGFVRIVRLVCQ